MRSPSADKLVAELRVSRKDANLIKRLARATDNHEALQALIEKCCPETERYVRSMYSSPYDSKMWRVTVALHAMDRIVGTHGVESLGPSQGSSQAPPYEYLNMGDPYVWTLIYKRSSDNLFLGSWGDIAERHPSWP